MIFDPYDRENNEQSVKIITGFWIGFWSVIGLILPLVAPEKIREHQGRRRVALDQVRRRNMKKTSK